MAILAADLAGYSRLMSMDEHATVEALDSARAVFRSHIEARQGRVIDMAGDSVLAVFETATGAVVTAMCVQRELQASTAATPEDRKMRYRIGVHLGDVIVKADGTVYGDGVNIAARLEGLAEPGGITVSDSVRIAVKGKVGASFEDQGEQIVKNIADPVRAYRVRPESAAPTQTKSLPSPSETDLTLPDKPSIAVLAFTNMSGDPEQEYFTDGITEDIITELSRFQSLFVIARNSSFTYKGRAVDVKQVGRELGVRYVVEGSIRRSGNRIRVTAQLIDSLTGNHIWAEKYDRVVEDVFAVQEEVTECIVGAIAPTIDVSESLRARRRPGNLSAYELAVKAYAFSWEGHQKSDVAARNEALRLAQLALTADPDSVLALQTVGFVQWQHVGYFTAADREAAWNDGLKHTLRAISLAPMSSITHICKAFLLLHSPFGRRPDEARIEGEVAYRLNPQDCFTAQGSGVLLAVTGDAIEGIRILERSLRISPVDPYAFLTFSNLAMANFVTRDYRRGLEWAALAKNVAPTYANNLQVIVILHVAMGQLTEARAVLEAVRRLAPTFVQDRLDYKLTAADSEHQRRSTTFMRIAAGLEDPSAADALR